MYAWSSWEEQYITEKEMSSNRSLDTKFNLRQKWNISQYFQWVCISHKSINSLNVLSGGFQRDCFLRICCCSCLPWVWVSIGISRIDDDLNIILSLHGKYGRGWGGGGVPPKIVMNMIMMTTLDICQQRYKGGGDIRRRGFRSNQSSTTSQNLPLHHGRSAQVQYHQVNIWV